MKIILAATLLLAGMSIVYAQGLMLLGYGQGGSQSTVVTSCGNGTVDASAGCPMPMLGM